MKIFNRILGIIILLCCLIPIMYFIFPHLLWIRQGLQSWIYYFFFINPILLLVASNRFKKLNDIKGRNLGYFAASSFVAIIIFPLFIFLFDMFFLGINLPDFILMIFPFVSLILSFIVIYRLFKNKQMINFINPITEHPYK
ncbi:MAG: hypothetical protein WCI91_01550 [Candidatus Nomurabacteria bacterium]